MQEINWKQKLTSRKWWSGLINVVVQIMYLTNFAQTTIERVAAILASAAGLIAATIAECLVDAARVNAQQVDEEENNIGF